MHSSSQNAQALVVGAGPSGLVLALILLRNGISVRIIDKSPLPRIGQRGAGIMPRSLELFHFLGIAEQIRAKARPMPLVRVYTLHGGMDVLDTFELNPPEEPTSSTPYPNLMLLGQDSLESILRDELAKYGCNIELGTELVSFSQGTDFVDVKILKDGVVQPFRYSWLLGADGARSTVRKQLGATFLGETPNVNNIVVGDIKVKGLDNNFWHMWGDAATTLISLRPTDVPNLFGFILSGEGIDHTVLSKDADYLRNFLVEKTGTPNRVSFEELTWISTHRPNIRMVDTFNEGRVLLAGDSCHVISFTGGQGMNTGIQDSFNLGWKVALVEHTHSPFSLIKTYQEERLPIAADMLEQTTTLLRQEFAGRRNGAFSQLEVNYRWSSIVADEQQAAGADLGVYPDEPDLREMDLRAGDRAPDALGLIDVRSSSSTALFDVFGVSYHTVLIFSANPALCTAVHQAIAKYPVGVIRTALICLGKPPPVKAEIVGFVLEDASGHAYDAYPSDRCTLTVVRPDGMIGAIVQGVDGLTRYFDQIFGYSIL